MLHADEGPRVNLKKVLVYAKRRVFDGFFKIDEAELEYERFDGRMSEKVRRLCFERGDSVAAVVYDRDRAKALFVRQFKYPTYEKGPGWIMELVAGSQEFGESAEAAMKRELREEMGYDAESLVEIATFYVSPGGSSERIVLFYVEVSSSARVSSGGGAAEEGEDIETVEHTIPELRALLSNRAIDDAKTLVGIQWLLARLGSSQ